MHGVVPQKRLHVEASYGRQIEHGVEGRHFEHADFRHAEQFGDRLDGSLRQPAAALRLRAPQDRDHRGLLAALRIFCDLRFRPSHLTGG